MYIRLITKINMITRGIKQLSKYLNREIITNCYYNNTSRAFSSGVETCNNSNEFAKKHIVWLDMEMTGLEVEKYHILEIACLITDQNLSPVSDYLDIVIHQSDEILNNMTDWCKTQHKKTGLIDDCQSSKVTLEEAQKIMLQFLEKHIPRETCPLAGNSIYMDRMFLRKYMPLVDNYLHYRLIDVSSIRELARRWQPGVHRAGLKKEFHHRAMLDIEDSLNELRYYKDHLFITNK